jgi:molybdopterin-guanine dinucleotide biosynthesis protein A
VLAGGESSRMGTDKALVQLRGEPLIIHALRVLREAGLESMIAGARSELSAYSPVVKDDGRGPLGGICAALASTRAEYALFLPVDMPLMPAALLSFLLGHARTTDAGIALASVSGFVQTFPAVVHREALPGLQTQLSAGHGGCFAAFRLAAEQTGRLLQVAAVEDLVQSGQIEDPRGLPAAFWFLNVNAPDDLARAQGLLSSFA